MANNRTRDNSFVIIFHLSEEHTTYCVEMICNQGLQTLGCAYGEPIFLLYGILHGNGYEALKFGSITKLC